MNPLRFYRYRLFWLVLIVVFSTRFAVLTFADDENAGFSQSHDVLAQIAIAPLKTCKQSSMQWTLKTQCAPLAVGVGKARSFLKERWIDAANLDRGRGLGAILFYSAEGYPSLVPLVYLPTSDTQAIANAAGQFLLANPLSGIAPDENLSGAVNEKPGETGEKSGETGEKPGETGEPSGEADKSDAKAAPSPTILIEKTVCCGIELVRVSVKGQPAWFVRTVDNWTFLSPLDAALLDLPKSPDKWGQPLTKQYLIGWEIRFDRIIDKQKEIQDALVDCGKQALRLDTLLQSPQIQSGLKLLTEILAQAPESVQKDLKSSVRQTIQQVTDSFNDALGTLPNSLEGGVGIDKTNGTLFGQAKASFDEKRNSTLLNELKQAASSQPRFGFILNSPAAFSAVGIAPETNIEWLARQISDTLRIPFNRATENAKTDVKSETKSDAKPDSASDSWREWGLAVDLSGDGFAIGLGTTCKDSARMGKVLYELAARGESLPELDAKRWGVPCQGKLKRTGRHAVYQLSADVLKNDSRQTSVSLAFGPRERFVVGDWNESGKSLMNQILAVRYQDASRVFDSSLDNWLFCGQIRVGTILSAFTGPTAASDAPSFAARKEVNDKILFKAGLKENSVVFRTEVQNAILPSVVRLFETLSLQAAAPSKTK